MKFSRTVGNVKVEAFFDRVKMLNRRDEMEVKILSRAAAFYRKVVMNSMKRPGKGPSTKISKPGRPPRYHTRLLKDNIRFGYDRNNHEAVIGILRFKRSKIPEALEFGGTSTNHLGESVKVQARPFLGNTSVNWPKAIKKLNELRTKTKF